MTITYYGIGRRIVEKEQQGEKRAQYGKRILQGLSEYLTANLGKGYSVENLTLMRRFYMTYSEKAISQSPITKFNSSISWTHYIHLLRIANDDERLSCLMKKKFRSIGGYDAKHLNAETFPEVG